MEKVSSKLIRGAIYDNIKQLKDQKIIALTTGAWSKFEGDVDVGDNKSGIVTIVPRKTSTGIVAYHGDLSKLKTFNIRED